MSRLRNREEEVGGAIVVGSRGECPFVEKALRAVAAGASALVVGNTAGPDPHSLFPMHGSLDGGGGGQHNPLPIPCVMISQSSYNTLLALLDHTPGLTCTLDMLRESDIGILQDHDMGSAVRAATLHDDTVLLRALLARETRQWGKDNPKAAYNAADVDRCATPVHLAIEYNLVECLSTLLQCQPQTDLPRVDAFFPLHLAAEKNSDVCMSLLIAAGAYLDAPHDLGWTALHFVAAKGAVDCASLLIRAEASINYRAKDGSTPLLIACLFGQETLARLLLMAGADPSIPNHRGLLPKDYASHRGDRAVMRLLEEHARDPQVPSSRLSPAPPLSVLEDHRVTCLRFGGDSNEVWAADWDGEDEQEEGGKARLVIVGQVIDEVATKASSALDPVARLLDSTVVAIRSWCCDPPSLRLRKELMVAELPAGMREELWVVLLSSTVSQRRSSMEEEEEEEEEETAKPRSLRERSLYDDLSRNKFTVYSRGVAMERVRDLIVNWLEASVGNEYRQGLTSLAAPLVEVYGEGRGDQALVCLNLMIEKYMEGLFKEGSTMETIQSRIRAIERLLLYWDPDLLVHLSSLEVIGELFATSWLITLFADVLPMDQVLLLWDILVSTERSFLSFFAAAVVLQLRDRLMEQDCQAGVLTIFSQVNAEVIKINVHSCLQTAFRIYGATPQCLLRARSDVGDGGDLDALPEGKAEMSHDHQPGGINELLSSMVMDQEGDLEDVEGHICVVDARDCDYTRDCHGLHPIPLVGDDIPVVAMPYQTIRGHVDYCLRLRGGLQPEMKPPPPFRPWAQKGLHTTVYADSRKKAVAVARALVFSHVPHVSLYMPPCSSPRDQAGQ